VGAYVQRKTEVGNEVTSPIALLITGSGAGSQPQAWGGRIVSEANAFGKAKGYADGDTTTGTVGLSVAMDTS
jgi:hypothetical protein